MIVQGGGHDPTRGRAHRAVLSGGSRGDRMTLASFRRRCRLVAILTIPSFAPSGCYRAVPVEGTPPSGSEVVLEMTDEATARLGGFLGRGTVDIRGRLLDWTQDSIVVSMIATENTLGQEQLWRNERVAIPRAAVARVRERRLNRTRTSALVLAIGALVTTGILVSTRGEGGTSGGGTKPVPQ